MTHSSTRVLFRQPRRPYFSLPHRLPDTRSARQSELQRAGEALMLEPRKTQARRLIRHIQVVFAEQLVDLLADDLPTAVGPRGNGDTAYFLVAAETLSGCWVWLHGHEVMPWLLRVRLQIGGWFQMPSRDGLFQLGISGGELNMSSSDQRSWELTLLPAELAKVTDWVCQRIVVEEQHRAPPSCPLQLRAGSNDPNYLWSKAADRAYKNLFCR